ncbi:MAG: protein translocase subunit SecD [Coriobacteriales bacterium]|jgi:protein-export membrane protein SecD|nr:protein translocase subunit SecD [Coriobacteriales bacterium]
MADRRFKVKKKAAPSRPHVTLLVLLLVLLAGSVLMFWPPQERVKQGLDVQGGLSVVLQASKPDGSEVSSDEMTAAAQIVERRVNLLGASEASVQVQGSSQLLVQMPGAVNQTQALNTIGSTGVLEFVDVAKITDENAKNAIEWGMTVDRDYLMRLGALAGLSDVPVNAQQFTSGSSGLITGTSESGDEAAGADAEADEADADADDAAKEAEVEKEPFAYPTSMTTNPLTGETLPLDQALGQNWVPLRLAAGSYTPIFSGSSITNVTVNREPASPYYSVSIDLDGTAAQAFGAVTTELYPTKGKIAILLDGYVQSAPAVQSAITNGKVSITGNYTVEGANQLKTILQSGSLPVTLDVATSQVVGPTLGQDSLRAGVLVAIIGLIIVALYLLVFYKGIGLLTAGAVAVFAVLYLGVLALLSYFGLFALSLAGIAGIVLAIGVAADSSILVLERFKEEIRMGRSVRASSITGVKHAIITSIDADLVTLVSALALFFIAVGSVKGFGLTLALGVICDIVTMLIFKAPVIRLLAPRAITRHPGFWGIREDEDFARASGELKRGVENG